MVLYEVTLETDPSRAAAVENHMRRQHIPGILRTGCFRQIRFDYAAPGRFRTCYQADSPGDLERYLREHSPAFRAEFQAEFPSGVSLSRETWVQRQVWNEGV